MKKSFSLIFVLLLCFMLVGCKNKKYETPELSEIEILSGACQNLIIIIGDGMGEEQIKAGEILYNKTYEFTTWNKTYSDTCSYDSFTDDYDITTDSAAGGTAIATGVVTYNGFVGKDMNGNDLSTILDYANKLGKSTGVLTTDSIVGATPSDFSGHAVDRSMSKEIIDTQLCSNIDLFIGQYSDTVNDRAKDIKKYGYTYYTSYESIQDINKQNKVWCQFSFEEYGEGISLKDATEVAVNYLSQNDKGYVLLIEQAHIDKFSHNNEFSSMAKAVNSLNDTVEYVKSISNNNTAIIITADHETGGLKVSSENIYDKQYENVYYHYLLTSHTSTEVPVYVYGFDVDFKEFSMYDTSEKIKNKDIFNIALYSITKNKIK